ncbi:hypothetical protein [Methylobacterium sp. AMS5]|uniref:hypothetical protein n=1 Tax=Methylobacterium sp. AMS5 TaxID=925818 RepID=UPI00074F9E8E|nr:hypothetical protein [Methylobacterium sp. AMS5]AMB45111.1 hypothetical protein Y590_09390 [Methylobacterium sp. AMS5]
MRTIVEINNDSAAAVRDGGQEVADLLARALMSGSDAAWDRLRRYGIKRIVERHPTEPAKVVVGEREIAVR